jgi:hypothetical protein
MTANGGEGRCGAQGRNRTTDTCIFSAVLYQLSYLGAASALWRTKEERGVYRGSIPPCPEWPSSAGTAQSGWLVACLCARRSILVFFFLHRNRVHPAEPAVEVDIGATPAAKRAEWFGRRLAAERTWLGAQLALGHALHMVIGERAANLIPR